MRLFAYYVSLFLALSVLYACNQSSRVIYDHHVHIFSPSLLNELKKNPLYDRQLVYSDNFYSDIDTIYHNIRAKRFCIIGSAYAYPKQISDSELRQLVINENNFISLSAKQYEQNTSVFYGIDPLWSFAMEELKRCHKDLYFYGLKLHLRASNIQITDTTHQNKLKDIFQYTGAHDIPVLIHLPKSPNEEIELLFNTLLSSKFHHTIILAHMGGQGLIDEETVDIINHARSISTQSNLNIYFDLSGIVHPERKLESEIPDHRLVELIKKFETDKLLYGSDYPMYNSVEYIETLKTRLSLSDDLVEEILTNTIE